jgi:chaperonin cofactor prefoldin
MEEEIARLRRDLTEAEAALRSSRSMGEVGEEGRSRLEAEIKALRTANDDKAAEIARLSAALHIYEDTSKNDRSIAESKMALKAKVAALQQQTEDQTQQIQRLRAEIAAANERAARQAAHLMEEMRRLGSGTYPTTVGRPATRTPEVASEPRRTLTDRIAEPRGAAAQRPGTGTAAGTRVREPVAASAAAPAAALADPRDLARASGFLRALGGGGQAVAPTPTADKDAPAEAAATGTDGAAPKREAQGQGRRGSLLDRITRIDQSE